jgi:hypothetical protein
MLGGRGGSRNNQEPAVEKSTDASSEQNKQSSPNQSSTDDFDEDIPF